jgi:peptidoglycan/LPS O-acetylase OafA/YrhL
VPYRKNLYDADIERGGMATKLSQRVSAGLDAARAIAAIYVVIHHWATSNQLTNGPGLIFRFGQEAVIVFFLLSGFVIFANDDPAPVWPDTQAVADWALMNSRGERILSPECG